VALYGPEHPIAAEALSEACRELGASAGGGGLEVKAEEDGLLWNGTRLASGDGNVARFHSTMRDRLIASIEISSGVGPRDLAHLLRVLAMEIEDIEAAGGITSVFGEGAGSGIRITLVDFTGEMLVPEAVWRQLTQGASPEETGNLRKLIACCAGGLGDNAGASATGPSVGDPGLDLEPGQESAEDVVAAGIARLIQRAGEAHYFTDDKHWQSWREATAAELAGLSPQWRSAIFRAPVGASSECPDMLSLIAAEMDESNCVSIVLDHPDSIRADRSGMLAVALERILADRGRRRSIEAALHRQALAQGVPEEVYQNVVGILVSRIEGRWPAEPQTASSESEIIDSDAPVAPERTDDVGDLLQTTRDDAVWRSSLCVLLESLHAHLTIGQYGTVISLLAKSVEECLARGDLEGLMAVVSELGREAAPETEREPSRRGVAAGALARVSTDPVVSFLAERLGDVPDGLAAEIIELFGLLGEPGMSALADVVRAGKEADAKCAMGALLARDGPDMSHARDLVSAARGIALERALLGALDGEGEQAPQTVMAVLADAGEEAWLQTVQLIFAGGRGDLGEVLVRMLHNPSGPVRMAAINAIAELAVKDAVPGLCEIAEAEAYFGEGARLREAAVRALAAIGESRAVRSLCAVLEGKALLSKLGSHRPRAAAAEALGILGGPDSREALEKGSKSMHPVVRDTCRRALARLLAGQPPVRGKGSAG
jgi:HEAT repeat protein